MPASDTHRAIDAVWRIESARFIAAAKHRALDFLRREKLLERKHEELGRELEVLHARADQVHAARADAGSIIELLPLLHPVKSVLAFPLIASC